MYGVKENAKHVGKNPCTERRTWASLQGPQLRLLLYNVQLLDM